MASAKPGEVVAVPEPVAEAQAEWIEPAELQRAQAEGERSRGSGSSMTTFSFWHPAAGCSWPRGLDRNPWEFLTMEERMMKWFAYGHLPENLQHTSKRFYELACYIVDEIEAGPERTVALRKLLESKDAAVRANLHEGG